MTTPPRTPLSLAVTNVVYVPTTMAYSLFIVDHAWLALSLYLFFMLVARFKLELFDHLREWPWISRIALYAGPPYLAFGFLFPGHAIGYWAALPIAFYTTLTVAGGVALRRAKIER